MSNFSEWFNDNAKVKLNKELDRHKPAVIAAVRKQIAKGRTEVTGDAGDFIKDLAIKAVKKTGIFGLGSILLTTLIASLDLDEMIGDSLGERLANLEEKIVSTIQGARL